MADCRESIKNLSEYIDGEIDPELCAELEKHLQGCTNCRLVMDSLKMTVKLCRDGVCEDLPESLQKKFEHKLAERWKNKFGRI